MANLPVPSPRTFSVNEVQTGAFLNSIRDALNFLLNPPQATLVQTAAQSIPNNSATALTFDTTVLDSYGGHSNTTNPSRYTAIVAGTYLVSGVYAAAVNSTGQRYTELHKNGAVVAGTQETFIALSTIPTISGLPPWQVYLNAGDYIEMFVTQNSGGALNTFVTAPSQSSLEILWVHA